MTLFEERGDIIMVLVLGSPDRFGEAEQLFNCIQ